MPSPEPASLIAALHHPEAYPEAAWEGVPPEARQVECIQTHISVVFLTARLAFKWKKPLQLWGLLDYGSPERRLHWCREEVRLNQRLAPTLYLGIAPLLRAADGELSLGPLAVEVPGAEHVVVMRRFAAADTLRARLEAGRAGATELRALGERIGRFHRAHRLDAESSATAVAAFAAVLHNNVRATRCFVPALFPASVHRLLEHELAGALRQGRALLRRRIAAGRGVDGHGDLRLEHVLLSDPIAVVDAVEFNASLRRVDGASDLAFLVMELQAAGHGTLVEALLAGYGEPIEPAALALFCAYRAHVRAKVGAVTGAEADLPLAQRQVAQRQARAHLSLALACARCGRTQPALILLHGPSAAGKSHLAAQLAPWLLADLHRSDLVRKRLHGLAAFARPQGPERERLYGAEANRRTEAALLADARASLLAGHSVLLDATHLRAASRQRGFALARELGAVPLLLDLRTSLPRLRSRLDSRLRRDDDPSDADPAVLRDQLLQAEPLGEAEQPHCVAVGDADADDPSRVLMALWERLAALLTPGIRPVRATGR